jgi:8-oxo-dGTP pyrophosphatase MutT (NUDIX family)
MSTDGRPGSRPAPTLREESFGGVVVRGGRRDATPAEVAVIVPHGRRILGLPKGGPESGETPVQTATREIREETGLVAEADGDELGAVHYWYSRRGRRVFKTVHFFLFRHVSGSTDDHDHEVDEVRWLPIEEARTRLTHSGEREMVALAAPKLRSDR